MTDPVEPTEEPATDAPLEDEAGPQPPPPKRRRAFRLWALIVLPLLLLLVVLSVWLFGDGFLRSQIRSALLRAGLEPGDTVIESSLFGGRVALIEAEIVAEHETEQRTVYRSPETVLDLAVLDSAIAGSPIIDRLAMREAVIDLRRFSDGSIPGTGRTDLPEEVEPDADEEAPEEQAPRDLVELYQRWRDRYQKVRKWIPEDADGDDQVDQPSRPAAGWRNAVRFYPQPRETDTSPFPRVLIRELDISGSGIVLPDSQLDASNPLDVERFALSGATVTSRLEPDETMSLDGEYRTLGAGAGDFAYRAQVDQGAFAWGWDDIPLAVVARPEVSGDRLADYRPSGTGRLALTSAWQDETLEGEVVLELIDLELDPTAAAGPEAREVAKGLKELRALHAKLGLAEPLVIRWRLTLGGSPDAPRITDLGAESFERALKDTAKRLRRAVEDKTREVAGQAKDAALEEGKGLIEDIRSGDDAEESAKERLKRLEGQGDSLKNLFGK